MTSQEPLEPIDEEGRSRGHVDLEDVTQFEHTQYLGELVDDINENSLEQSIVLEEPNVPDLLID